MGRGAPVHPLIPDDAMTVSNQPCVDGRQFARVFEVSLQRWLVRPCVGAVVRHLEPLAIKDAGRPARGRRWKSVTVNEYSRCPGAAVLDGAHARPGR